MSKYIKSEKNKNLISADANKDEKNLPILTVQNIYLKEMTYKAPNTPHIFRGVWKPKVELNVNISSDILSKEDQVYEVVLQATVTIKSGENDNVKEAFIATVLLAGAFTIKIDNEDTLNKVLQITCPTLLYPYLQELLSNLAGRGGFPKLMLPAFISFEALYETSITKAKNK